MASDRTFFAKNGDQQYHIQNDTRYLNSNKCGIVKKAEVFSNICGNL